MRLQYAGYTFEDIQLAAPYEMEAVYNGPDYLYTRHRLSIRAVLNPMGMSVLNNQVTKNSAGNYGTNQPGQLPAQTLEAIRLDLMQPRQMLLFLDGPSRGMGGQLLVVPPQAKQVSFPTLTSQVSTTLFTIPTDDDTPVTDAITLTGGTASCGGQITVWVEFPNGLVQFLPPITVSGNSTYTSGPFTPGFLGDYRFHAIYSGDANNGGATDNGNNESFAVEAASPPQPAPGGGGPVPPPIPGTPVFNFFPDLIEPEIPEQPPPPSGANIKYQADVNNGPVPLRCNVVNWIGFRTAMVDFVIETYVRDFVNDTIPYALLSHRWAMAQEIDEHFKSSRTIVGKVILRTDSLTKLNLSPDAWRSIINFPLPPFWKRENVKINLNEAGNQLDYTIEDQEYYVLQTNPPTGVNGPFEGMIVTGLEATHSFTASRTSLRSILAKLALGTIHRAGDVGIGLGFEAGRGLGRIIGKGIRRGLK